MEIISISSRLERRAEDLGKEPKPPVIAKVTITPEVQKIISENCILRTNLMAEKKLADEYNNSMRWKMLASIPPVITKVTLIPEAQEIVGQAKKADLVAKEKPTNENNNSCMLMLFQKTSSLPQAESSAVKTNTALEKIETKDEDDVVIVNSVTFGDKEKPANENNSHMLFQRTSSPPKSKSSAVKMSTALEGEGNNAESDFVVVKEDDIHNYKESNNSWFTLR